MERSRNPPVRWGAYFLIRYLGGGGMGDVYLALTGRRFEKLCVVKRLTADTLENADRVKRFRREAEIVRRLSHGTIAQTFAVDEFEGEPFIAQEFIEGRNITQLTAAARSVDVVTLPIEIAVHIVREIARALGYAHRAGVVHRDVAPDNVMVTFDGHVRLIDFGMARALVDTSLTAPGTLIGRWSYTAPEVLAGTRGDQRADVYAAGVVLWELLTGHAPTFRQRETPPAPSSLRPDVPAALDIVVLQAIAADPAHRFGTAQDFERALHPFLPRAFSGDLALRGFASRCYDVALLRQRLVDEIAEMKAVQRQQRQSNVSTSGAHQPRNGAYYALAAIGAIGAAGALFSMTRPRAERNRPPVTSSFVPKGDSAAESDLPNHGQRLPAQKASSPAVMPVAAELTPVVGRAQAGGVGRPSVILDRARDSIRAGDLVAAERDARGALETGTAVQKASAHLILGKIYLSRGQTGAASAEFKVALQLDPGNDVATTALNRLNRRRR